MEIYHNYKITILGENCRTFTVSSSKVFPQEIIDDALYKNYISDKEIKWVASIKEV